MKRRGKHLLVENVLDVQDWWQDAHQMAVLGHYAEALALIAQITAVEYANWQFKCAGEGKAEWNRGPYWLYEEET